MSTISNPFLKEIQYPVTRFPAVSVILPFEPKMSRSTILLQALRSARNKVEKNLYENYPAEMATLVMEKLLGIYKNIDFNTHRKSIAIYVSPLFEKILYLNMEAEENIIVDDFFDIKDLPGHIRESHQFTVLVLTQGQSKLYTFNSGKVIRIFSSTPALAREYTDHMISRDNNQAATAFLRYTDNVLDKALSDYPYPFFILGEAEIVNEFKKISRHKNIVIEYILSNQPATDPVTIETMLRPYVENGKLLNQKNLMAVLRVAEEQVRIVTGIKNVLQEAIDHKGSLLVIERDFIYPHHEELDKVVFMKPRISNKFSYIKDAVGYIIEKVLENGGDIKMADKNSLERYQHIALIK